MIFLFFGSSLAHLEPKLQLFEVDDHGNADNDDLSHHHLQNFKIKYSNINKSNMKIKARDWLINWLKKVNRMLNDQLMIRSLSNSWSPTDQPTWLEIGQLVDLIKNNQPDGQWKNIDQYID